MNKALPMTSFTVPTYAIVSPANQALFDGLKKGLGMVPNLCATLMASPACPWTSRQRQV